MNSDEKLLFLKELLRCSYPLCLSEYDDQGVLLHTDSDHTLTHELLVRSGCLNYALQNGCDAPLCLSTGLGLLWGAVSCQKEEGRRLYILGPVLNVEIPQKTIRESLKRFTPSLQQDREFRELLASLPVVPLPLLLHYILMLVFTLTGVIMSTSSIQYQAPDMGGKKVGNGVVKRDRHQTYMAEKLLLYHVREGNTDCAGALARSSSLSTGVQIKTGNPISQAVISTTVFTSLCTREAIAGGLSPDIAYSVGDAYIQAMVESKTISELSSLSHAMYYDFIYRVKNAKSNSGLSGTIQECCDYIRTHTEDELSIAILARLVGYTDYYLSRKFKKETGISIAEYIDQTRIEKAKILLESTFESIADIARSLHYCSSTYFSETFRRITGMLPNAYRKEKQRK